MSHIPIKNYSRLDKPGYTMWLKYGLTYLILLTLSFGQSIILAQYVDFLPVPPELIGKIAGFWALITAIFFFVTNRQKFHAYEKPMRKLSEAAKKVSKGDFSVYLEPAHNADKLDYIDVMFEDFNKMVEELGSIETLKNNFIAGISHKISMPLSVIRSHAPMLKKEELPPQLRDEYAETILATSENLTALVTNILKLNKLENQEILPITEPFDLCRQLCDCALIFEGAWEQKNIEFTADMDDRAMIRADESILEIVWHNLLSNALKFTEPGGKVCLSQTSEEDSIMVSFSDTGCGMDRQTMKHIFDKFYQGNTSRSGEGNGLGLALSLRAVELAGGTISVKSEPGKGSVFTVRLKTEQ